MRAVWKGTLSFGLVSIPVKLYPATREKGVKLSLVCSQPGCDGDIIYKRLCKECGAELDWSRAKRSYRVAKKTKVVLTREEIRKALPKSTRALEIKEFVNLESIEPVFYDKNYYLLPQEEGERAFALLREVMTLKHKAALGKISLAEKERIVAIRPYKNILLASTLFYPAEVRLPEEMEVKPAEVKKEEIDLASLLVEKMCAEADLTEYRDEYRENIMKLVEAKLSGAKVEAKREVEAKKAKDMMEALRQSIEAVK
jgi:DNA end-binding protein Ku